MEEQLDLFGAAGTKKPSSTTTKQSLAPASITKKENALPKEPGSKTMPQIVLHVFVDGAARGNPGPSGAGVYITTKDRVPLIKKGYYLKHKTNNQAEYLAFILACLHVQTLIQHEPNTRIIFHSDSQLLVRQIQGMYKVKNEVLIGLHQCAQKLLRTMLYTITHVAREDNTNADALANLGVDKRTKIPQAMAVLLEKLGVIVD